MVEKDTGLEQEFNLLLKGVKRLEGLKSIIRQASFNNLRLVFKKNSKRVIDFWDDELSHHHLVLVDDKGYRINSTLRRLHEVTRFEEVS